MKKMFTSILLIILLQTTPTFAKDVIYGGESIGINVQFNGIIVNGTYTFSIDNETINPSNYIKEKDIIVEADGQQIKNLASFFEILDKYKTKFNKIPIQVKRNDIIMDTILITNYQENRHQTGLYLKENMIGIGTITYYDIENGNYGALGHSITEKNNPTIYDGSIYTSTINGIQKPVENKAGAKIGDINYNQKIGNIKNNNLYGIFGKFEKQLDSNKTIEVAQEKDIKEGEATFLTVISGNKIESFTLVIKDIDLTKKEKAFTIEITDSNLIQKTEGIIHGMSGSPIIQNNKIVGAITHVDSNNPIKGYGIFIQTMLDESNKLK